MNALRLHHVITNRISSSPQTVWSWKCKDRKEGYGPQCSKEKNTASGASTSLVTCQLTCGHYGTLWPYPKSAHLEKKLISFLPSNMKYSSVQCQDPVCSLLNEAFEISMLSLDKYHPKFRDSSKIIWGGRAVVNHKVKVRFFVSGREEYLSLDTDESYTLNIETKGSETDVRIEANTFFGARHALETLSQLINYDDINNTLQIVHSANIKDAPAFPYRGILLDTSRNFYPVSTLKRILDGMSFDKLNTFHWHISDSQTFPLRLRSLPKMAMYGTYHPEQVYTPEDVKDLVGYARVRGIRVLPELDAPAHVGHGWEWGEEEGLGKLVVCLDKEPWPYFCPSPPCGQLNLANENIYKVLEKIYVELAELFQPLDMFHFGGDEVEVNCWNTSSEISDWMVRNGFGLKEQAYFQQWSVFQAKARDLLIKANKGKAPAGIIWTSNLTAGEIVDKYLNKDEYIIQIWTAGTDPVIKQYLKKGYKVIFSNYDALYLDCGVSSWTSEEGNWCSPYKGWQNIYDNNIVLLAENNYRKQILGAEGAAWSEQADENTIDAKLWPRGSALAERLWSNPSSNYSFAENRILHHRRRLVQRGLKADRLQPEWCRQNGGHCRRPWTPFNEGQSEKTIDDDTLIQLASASHGHVSMEFNVMIFFFFNVCVFLVLVCFGLHLKISIRNLVKSLAVCFVINCNRRNFYICIFCFITMIICLLYKK
ncbi:UNVERIFIED_CONTAM: hypothetical protein GTU68_037765 [Idotea baltica]|nr:hypothetical protein [Idotea baltica]